MEISMKCPICGKEYEGDKCPDCSGLEITVNESDYLKRKMEYEEKQTKKKSASSANTQKVEKKKTIIIPKDADKRIDDIRDKSLKAVYKKAEDISTRVKSRNFDKIKQHKWYFIIPLAVIVVLCIGIGMFIGLNSKKNYDMYINSDGKIYNVKENDNEYICDADSAVFASDNETFFIRECNDGIDKSKLVQTMISQNGKYNCAVTYDDDSKMYTLYLVCDNNIVTVSQNLKTKSIINVTDDGKVIYTDTDVLNDEGAVGGIELYIYNAGNDIQNGKLSCIEDNLLSVNDYAKRHLLICYNKDLSLYTYDYEATDGKKGIADDVSCVCAMSEKNNNVFTGKAADINNSDNADAVVYASEGRYLYHNFEQKKDENDIVIAPAVTAGEEFIIKKNKFVYAISSGSISYAVIKDGKVGDFSVIDDIGQLTDYVYSDKTSGIIMVNSSGQLVSISDGNKKNITDGVADGSLSLVKNSDIGITYIKSNIQYYRASASSDEYAMKDNISQNYTGETYLYKNKLYFYTGDNQMYECTIKGENLRNIGSVEYCWIGSKHK